MAGIMRYRTSACQVPCRTFLPKVGRATWVTTNCARDRRGHQAASERSVRNSSWCWYAGPWCMGSSRSVQMHQGPEQVELDEVPAFREWIQGSSGPSFHSCVSRVIGEFDDKTHLGLHSVRCFTEPTKDRSARSRGALEVLGERWTMVIIRDAFLGVRRFDRLPAPARHLTRSADRTPRWLCGSWPRLRARLRGLALAVPRERLGELLLVHPRAALDAGPLRVLVELLLGLEDIHAAVRLAAAARGRPALRRLRVGRSRLVLQLPVIAALLGDVLDRIPGGAVGALLAAGTARGRCRAPSCMCAAPSAESA